MTTPRESPRPGATYFAPDVRIVALGELRDQGEAGEDLELERPHIISVEVTRVHSGVSQYSIVLNNWNDALPAQPRSENQRAWPPFRYNNLEVFEFGQRLRIDMRYWPDSASDSVEPVRAAHRWVPMIAGPITDMRFSFPSGEGAQLTLVGEDDLYPLRNKITEDRTLERSEKEIIEDVLLLAVYPLPLQASDHWERMGFFSNPSSRRSFQLNEGQSYLEFIEDVAKRFDCEVYVDFDDLASEEPRVQFYVEPARSLLPPDENVRDLYVLERGRWLIAARQETLPALRRDFRALAPIYITGNYGDFAWANLLRAEGGQPASVGQRLASGLPRFFGIVLPLTLMGLYLWRPDLLPFINLSPDVVTLIFLAWLLLSIDALLNLGVVSGLTNLAKGLKELK